MEVSANERRNDVHAGQPAHYDMMNQGEGKVPADSSSAAQGLGTQSTLRLMSPYPLDRTPPAWFESSADDEHSSGNVCLLQSGNVCLLPNDLHTSPARQGVGQQPKFA